MRLVARQTERGDTIIEVLFAVAVFAMVAVGALTIMNQGTATAERSLEITLVRAQIDAQAEAIRYIHQAYVTSYPATPTGTALEWTKMKAKGVSQASDFGQTNGSSCPSTLPANAYILNARKAVMSTIPPAMEPPVGISLPPFAQVQYDAGNVFVRSYGIWVEAVPSNVTNGTAFVDFHIRACWQSAGSNAPVTLGTIVRLYEPR
jgi:type II secretory pathway pseudopilin PulG